MNLKNKLNTKRNISLLLTFLLVFIFATKLHAQSQQFIEGTNYVLLDKILPTQSGDKIEVAELFWYRCPHCYALEPYIQKWKKDMPENATLVLIPALFSDRWEFSARVFYTFEALGLVNALSEKYFHSIYKEKKKINTVKSLAAWVKENGENAEDVINTFDSFTVENKINFAKLITINSGATGVPTLIVDGRYRTNISMAGSPENLFKVIDFLIEKVAQERAN